MKKITLILFAAILSSTAAAQSKTDALNAYIKRISPMLNGANVIPDSGVIVFKYERSEATRHTDGRKNIETVLKDAAMFQNSVSWGNMKTIIVNGKTFGGGANAAPDQVKPLFEGQEQPRRTFASMVKDSATVQQGVNGIKQGYDDATYFAEKFWEQFFNVFEYVKWIFYGTAAVALYFALVGRTEYTHTGKWQDKVLLWVQRTSSLVLFLDITVMVAMYLIQAILKIKTWDLPIPIILFILWLLVKVLAWGTSYVIPNATVNNGGFGYNRNRDRDGGNNQRQIGA